jgi:hypothetical protein
MRKPVLLLAMAIIVLLANTTSAQNVSGKIIRTAGNSTANAILDPTAFPPSGYTSKSTSGFLGDDVGNAKLGFKAIPAFSNEPFGDLRRGASHLYSDFVPDATGAGVYLYYDGTNLLFRMRLGTIVPGAKGYSILIDTDLKFGNSGPNADPNYIANTTGVNGNPGFEREIVLATGGTNDGILVYNIDNSDNASALTPTTYSGWTNYSQISIAGTNDNGDPDFFLDFYIPLSALGGGITASTPLRFNATTVMSGQAAIGGPKSDIYGVNDNSYKSTNTAWEAYINQQPSITPTSLSGTGTTVTSTTACTSAPSITSVTTTGGANSKGQVTGTWTKFSTSSLSSAAITIYLNGSTTPLTGTATATSGGTWTYDIPSSTTLSSGNTIIAKAQASGESMCLSSNTYTVSGCNNWAAANLVAPLGNSAVGNYNCFTSSTGNTTNKGVGGANRSSSLWTVYVNEAVNNLNENSTANQGTAKFSNNAGTTFNTATTGNWLYSDGCQGGSNLTSGVYSFWYQDPNGCKSDLTPICVLGNGGSALAGTIAIQPTISPSTATASTTSVTVTGAAGTNISLYFNGEVIATGAIAGTYNGTTTGSVTFSSLTFSNGGVLSALSHKINSASVSTSYCPAKSTAQTIGLCVTTAPVISADANSQITAGQPITGYSSEASGTTIKVYTSGNALVATVTTASNGSWTTSGVYNAVAGTIYYATAQSITCSLSVQSASAAAANATENVCGSITTSVTEATTSVSGSLSGTPSASTTINLYQDGMLVATGSTSISAWTINSIAAGTFFSNSTLSIGIRQGTNQEVICPNTKTVVCSSPPVAPTIVSPTNPTISSNSTVTYTLSNITSGNFYGIVDATSGQSLATGVWAPSSSNLTITTYPFTGSSGTVYNNIQIKTSSVSSTAVCTNYALSSNVTISSTLPVSFLSLSAAKLQVGVNVSWSVANETNVAYYVVERSADCISFEAIGQLVYNNSNATVKQYAFNDPASVAGKICYRIRQVDLNGKANYSNIVSIKANNAFSIQVAPNPVKESTVVYITSTKFEKALLQVVDMNGKVIIARTISILPGNNAIPLANLNRFARNTYIVKIVTSDEIYHQKLLLQ